MITTSVIATAKIGFEALRALIEAGVPPLKIRSAAPGDVGIHGSLSADTVTEAGLEVIQIGSRVALQLFEPADVVGNPRLSAAPRAINGARLLIAIEQRIPP